MATAQQRGNPAPKAGALFLSFLKYLVEYPTTFFVSFSPDKIEVGTASPLLGHQRIEREDWRQEGPFFLFPCISRRCIYSLGRQSFCLQSKRPLVGASKHQPIGKNICCHPLKVNIFLYSSVNTLIPMVSNKMVIFIKGQTKNVSGLFESKGDTKVSNTLHWPFTLMLISIKLPI